MDFIKQIKLRTSPILLISYVLGNDPVQNG